MPWASRPRRRPRSAVSRPARARPSSIPSVARIRLDLLLVERGLARSRAEASALLLAGQVELAGAGSRTLKPGQLVPGDAQVTVLAARRWASRGGEKLEAALDAFEVDPSDLACLDAGASTGGFTDVLLSRGARVVYAVDVGRGQLLERLRADSRVVSMERTNLRELHELPQPIQLATLDLSFISLRLVLPNVGELLSDDGRVIALVKPQFEARREAVPRGGVVRDAAVHRDVLLRFGEDAGRAGFAARANVEFLALLTPGAGTPDAWETQVERLTTSVV
ncbi:MAG: TlyA family RNA methyltransferase [Chloroflexi bacterium]|nr:MAG: TlyA family RNA methyltransferase [Chloroflexota bacterium]